MAKRKQSQKPVLPGYSTSSWSGHAHYHCTVCRFDTLAKATILNHLIVDHDSEAALEELEGLPSAPSLMEE
jgi:hypothetical protein